MKVNKWVSLVLILFVGGFALNGCVEAKLEKDSSKPTTLVKKQNKAIKKINKELKKQFTPLRNQYSAEYETYLRELESSAASVSEVSYQELLSDRDEYGEILNLLERAAILKNSLLILDEKIELRGLQVRELEQNVWKLDRKLEQQELQLSEAEIEKINSLIDTSVAIDRQNYNPVTVQDVASLKEQIFNQLN